ncbi:MAG: hypothetical protein B7Y47_03005 [Sphingomonas sp. 28-63-12]|nr:MAG: hypothetical protein B7Y47_03005 [Sphingomonas sp. 28-63-12]
MVVGLLAILGTGCLVLTRAVQHPRWGFAPTSVAVDLLPGLTIETAPPPDTGIIVTSRRSGDQAAAAAVNVGDIITAIDRVPVKTIDDANAYLKSHQQPVILLTLLHHRRPYLVRLNRAKRGDYGA